MAQCLHSSDCLSDVEIGILRVNEGFAAAEGVAACSSRMASGHASCSNCTPTKREHAESGDRTARQLVDGAQQAAATGAHALCKAVHVHARHPDVGPHPRENHQQL